MIVLLHPTLWNLDSGGGRERRRGRRRWRLREEIGGHGRWSIGSRLSRGPEVLIVLSLGDGCGISGVPESMRGCLLRVVLQHFHRYLR